MRKYTFGLVRLPRYPCQMQGYAKLTPKIRQTNEWPSGSGSSPSGTPWTARPFIRLYAEKLSHRRASDLFVSKVLFPIQQKPLVKELDSFLQTHSTSPRFAG